MDIDELSLPDGSPSWSLLHASFDSAAFDVGAFDDIADDAGLPVAEAIPVEEVLVQVAALRPGMEALGLLHGLAGRQLTYSERLRVIELWQPQKTWLAGVEQDLLLAYAGPTPAGDNQAALDDEFNPGPLARVLGSTTHHAFDRVFHARKLAHEFKDLGDRLRVGALDPYRVSIILETLLTFDDVAHALVVQEQILPVAAELGPGKLRKTLRRLAREVDPDWNTQMFVQAQRTRRVVFDPLGVDGLLEMRACLTPVEGLAVQQHLLKTAQVPTADPDDVRTMDERMADALTGTILGTVPGDPTRPMSPKVLVNVFTPMDALLGLQAALHCDATPATTDPAPATTDPAAACTGTPAAEAMIELEGVGPVPAGLLHHLGHDVAWRRWVLEPITGHLKDLGHERYRPDGELDEYARARDRYCRYPGCTRPAIRCDLDHLCAWCHAHPDQGGRTSAANLASECRRHHRGKTLGILTVTGDANGTLTWTDQHGRVMTSEPHNYNDGL